MKILVMLLLVLSVLGCTTPLPPSLGTYKNSWLTVDLRTNPPSEEKVSETLDLLPNGEIVYCDRPMTRAVGNYKVVAVNTLKAKVSLQEMKLSIIGTQKKTEWIPKEEKTWFFLLDPEARTFVSYDNLNTVRKARMTRTQPTSSTHCFVTGEVHRPGQIECHGDTRLDDVLKTAGGFTDYAFGQRITIRRMTDGIHYIIPATMETLILPGDIVVVGRKML